MIIFYDVDTQNDFILANGALSVPKAETLRSNLAKLTQTAVARGITIFGSVDRHFGTPEWKDQEKELKCNGGPFNDHCMDGTDGQKKIPETLISDKVVFVPSREQQDILSVSDVPQIIFEKQYYDVFAECGGNSHIDSFLEGYGVTEAIVYGVATDYCVKAAVLGLLQRKIEVYVVSDAITGVYENKSTEALSEMSAKGAIFIKTSVVTLGM